MNDITIERLIAAELPPEYKSYAADIARILAGVLNQMLTGEEAQWAISNPALQPALRALAGQPLKLGADTITIHPRLAHDVGTLQQVAVMPGGLVQGNIVGTQLIISVNSKSQPPRYAELQALVGFVIDLSSTLWPITPHSAADAVDHQIGRLEAFRLALATVSRDAMRTVQTSRSRGGEPQLRVFAYGHGVRRLERRVYNLLALTEIGSLLQLPPDVQPIQHLPLPGGQGLSQKPLLGNLVRLAEIVSPVPISPLFGERAPIPPITQAAIESRLRQLDAKVYTLDDLVPIWQSSGDIFQQAAPFIFGAPYLEAALERAVSCLSEELGAMPEDTVPVLFVIASGKDDIRALSSIRETLHALDAVVVTCLITQDVVPRSKVRRLFSAPTAGWTAMEQALFGLATPIRAEFRDDMEKLLIRKRWSFDPGAPLFLRVHHASVLEEFLRIVLSPLGL